MEQLSFQSKAQNLAQLRGRLKSAKVLELCIVKKNELDFNIDTIITQILNLNATSFIVRSSSLNEDSITQSNAGAFLSLFNIKREPEAITSALLEVAQSLPNDNDEILIQPYLENITLCGVAFSVDKDNFSPYYCIECDASGSNNAITDGSAKNKISYFSHRNYEADHSDEHFAKIIALVKELEILFDYTFLDVEFAFTKVDNTLELYCLQVRPLVRGNINLFHSLPYEALYRFNKRFDSFCKKTPNILGNRTIFGVMPDWNPAEIIGLRPKRLALSLYKEIITDNIWAYQRDNYGYKSMHSHPLMHSFLGIPYIDVRVSFNSFIPKNLNNMIAEKLVNYYLNRLIKHPEFHDKVEFEIVFSCYDFTMPSKLNRLLDSGFNANEIKRIEYSLLELTNSIINAENGYYTRDLKKVEKLKESYEKILHSNYSLIDKIYWSLQECKRLGTLPFAGIARAGFIAMLMLNSLVKIGFFSKGERQNFLNSLNTISKHLSYATTNLTAENKNKFLKQYGHLRAGSYDILSPRYDEDFEAYFSLNSTHSPSQACNFALSDDKMAQLDLLLEEHGLHINSKQFLEFLKIAIEGREYAKFEFSKLLSYTLVLIGELGVHYGISKEDMAHLDISDILSLYSTLYSKSPKQKLLDEIARHKEEYALTLAIKLPALISDRSQIFAFKSEQIMPNFITQKSVKAQIAQKDDEILKNKIVLIYAADPGYDYLFSKGIAGFITCYGGANSHMAIRASELELPAVIGVGEENFKKYCKAKYLHIDCESEQIICF
ncbi:hypothetical protein CQA53_01735 [Helicobacter didelphidarum]|uniref:PEP-utilising enzyme mobile domain-containing protein n=1 Tax=Helicobacter didelphidarum TaxID=2040648 RepID=A0A3D8IPU2_9HELI|nr:PEP-utilizing enzyme [Helicobacter didelphidarum]RDU67010.1 hypothetical protein CQA53_01735 [Helicobacter didelphidarum]